MTIDDSGRGLWSADLKHGDAMAVSDLGPSRPGLEKFGVHEVVRQNGGIGAAVLDARTGQVLWSTPADKDTGRGVAADIDPRFRGAEAWASNTLLEAVGALHTAGTKNAPVLSGDLFGDWREEVVWHTPDEKFLRNYTTPLTQASSSATA